MVSPLFPYLTNHTFCLPLPYLIMPYLLFSLTMPSVLLYFTITLPNHAIPLILPHDAFFPTLFTLPYLLLSLIVPSLSPAALFQVRISHLPGWSATVALRAVGKQVIVIT
jgi:hypothetical protein